MSYNHENCDRVSLITENLMQCPLTSGVAHCKIFCNFHSSVSFFHFDFPCFINGLAAEILFINKLEKWREI